VRVDCDVSGAVEAARHVDEVGERASDARPVLKIVQKVIADGVEANFRGGGGRFGEPWEPNRPGTLARKARMGQGSETLVGNGDLGAALTGGKGKRRRLGKSSTAVGVALFYARFLNDGTKFMPRRKVIGISDADRARSVNYVERYVIEGRLF
jgi:hypothetical protein